MKMKMSLMAAAFILLAGIVRLAAGEPAAVEVIAEPAADAGTHQAPNGDVILQIEGIPNRETIALDARGLAAFGTWGYTVTDPWLNTRVRYTGVLLASLLERLGAPADASVEAIASDGYRFSIPAREYARWPVLLATDSDAGGLGDKGPLRIIFPYDAHDDEQAARNMSVWALERLILR